jgi:hypothetical protein
MSNMMVANTILEQLGGSRVLQTMIGAHSFMGANNSLTFKFKARAAQRINCIIVTLTPADEYSVMFVRVWRNSVKTVEVRDAWAGNLIEVIENVTGLVLRMPKLRFKVNRGGIERA